MSATRGLALLKEIEHHSGIVSLGWDSKEVIFSSKGMQKQAEKAFNRLDKDVQKEARHLWSTSR